MRQPTLGRLTSFFEVRLLSRTDLEDGGRVRRWAVSTVLTRGRRSYIACGLSRCLGAGPARGRRICLDAGGLPKCGSGSDTTLMFRPRLSVLGEQAVELGPGGGLR